MKNNNILTLAIVFLITLQACHSQTDDSTNNCNRKTVDQSLANKLPKGICIPRDYSIDEIITDNDFDRDGREDIILRYAEYPLINGRTRYYAAYHTINDSTFTLVKELANILPPYLKNLYAALSSADTLSSRLAKSYPYDLIVTFSKDTIKLSHLIPDYYGKTYAFVFNTDNWYLEQVTYWIGGIDERDIEQMSLSPLLVGQNTLEIKQVNRISIDNFSLVESRRIADSEEKDYFFEKYNLFEWSNRIKR